ncbi:uncharacterized protein DUF4259 [Streptomyces sp. 1114.5]|uniref:DUF4259 domain-containing protein n=1 Tax=Streptomyces sp. 1114.5 TaxID=1938830 RepID=UPI000EB12DC4|nr:DUF4259 domain-containing protein [Streptomyces sp. 1114.5]RKT08840.1 uncharacterized protein DUF4259 [Streptomyces sp. 1114.5]
MGAWGIGHFGNDTAADFSGGLDEAAPSEREAILRAALEGAARASDYLDRDEGAEAVAAAALLAAQCPGGAAVVSSYAPEEEIPALAAELRALAVEALDRVVAEESELAELWEETGQGPVWRQGIRALRGVLEPVPSAVDGPMFQLWTAVNDAPPPTSSRAR